jgi:hypothetical protein
MSERSDDSPSDDEKHEPLKTLVEVPFHKLPATDNEWEKRVREIYDLIPGHKTGKWEPGDMRLVIEAIQEVIEGYYAQEGIELRKWSDHDSPVFPPTPRRTWS